MLGLGPIAFAAPWLLAGLAALPVVYWLLRVTPPVPRRMAFPAIRLLRELAMREETPHHTPWWLLVFRLLLAALVILALAQPVLNPNAALPGSGPVVVAVDNGWASAGAWPARQEALDQLIDQAGREGRRLVLLPTAPLPGGEPLRPSDALLPAEAREAAEALGPVPWPVDRQAATDALGTLRIEGARHAVWLSDGLAGPDDEAFAVALQRLGSLELLAPDAAAAPSVLRPPESAGAALTAVVLAVPSPEPRPVTVRASGPDGRLLGDRAGRIAPGEAEISLRLDLPPPLRNQVARLEIVGEGTAASVALLDDRWRRPVVGLMGEEAQSAAQPLLAPTHYLARALEPYGEVRRGSIEELVAADVTAILLPDRGVPAPEDRAALRDWMAAGGVLIRFAGPLLAAGPDPLVPVPLRRGDRTLGGALSWTEPMALAPFPPGSPLTGLDIPPDIRVDRQVLAEPALDLAERTWARLADGTPLVTAAPEDAGWLVLIHTAAEPGWSNLPLSGLFPEMLRRLTALGSTRATASAGRALEPLQTLDAYGRLGQPPPTALPLSGDLVEARVSPDHPPGFYGAGEARYALNLGSMLDAPQALAALPSGVVRSGYGARGEVALMPWLMAAALLLAAIDLLLALALRGLMPRLHRPRAVAATALLAAIAAGWAVLPAPAAAQLDERQTVELANRTYLAYVETGNPSVDRVSQAGLDRLSAVLRRRTAAEPAGAIGIDPAYDELAFFPLIYWPVTPDQADLPAATIARLNDYLRNGGMILFDTRDRGGSALGAGEGTRRLRTMLEGLDVPPLQPVPPEHVLTRAFYLLQTFPGRYAGGEVWVEEGDAHVNDGVSSIVIGGHDWAGAWAAGEDGQPIYPVVPGGERQRELAYRFGVNLVMYALTGNYKADQVHVPTILERLGQ